MVLNADNKNTIVTKLNSLINNLFKNKESLVDILASSQKLLHNVNKKMQ